PAEDRDHQHREELIQAVDVDELSAEQLPPVAVQRPDDRHLVQVDESPAQQDPHYAAGRDDGDRRVWPGAQPAVRREARKATGWPCERWGLASRAQRQTAQQSARRSARSLLARQLGSAPAQAVPAVGALGYVRADLRAAVLANDEQIRTRRHRRSILRTSRTQSTRL